MTKAGNRDIKKERGRGGKKVRGSGKGGRKRREEERDGGEAG